MIQPTHVLCKDGTRFSVGDAQGRNAGTIYLPAHDKKAAEAGLARYDSFYEPGDASAEYRGMPVDLIRAYCRLHGGVAEIGHRAKAALQAMSDGEAQAVADMPPPPPDEPEPPEEGVVVPFVRPRRLPAPRYPVGHSISSATPFRRPGPTDR